MHAASASAVNDTSALEDVDIEDEDAYVDAIKEQAEKLEEVGTPDDISDDAREGFEIYIEAIGEVDADDLDNPEDIEDAFSDDDKDKVEKYLAYQAETCQAELPDELDVPTDELSAPSTE